MARSATKLASIAAAAALVVLGAVPAAAHSGGTTPGHTATAHPLHPGVQLYVDPDSTTVQAAAKLTGDAKDDALLLAEYPTAIWLTKGTPRQVQAQAAAAVLGAKRQGTVAVLVAYFLPNRDCGQYSAGGAQSTAEYEAWIDGLARGIGNQPAAVVLEPDGLGLIPNYASKIDGSSNCSIAGADPADRFIQLNYAVDALKKHTHTSVYLDATHTGWRNVGESAQRLLMAGVQRADGFFLNVSNYQFTPNLVDYGTWVSSCVALAERDSAADPTGYDFGANCGNQYWNGGPDTGWNGTAMDNAQVWRHEPYSGNAADLAWNTVGIDSRYTSQLGSTQPTTHFVIDTSRNGLGPWTGGTEYPDRQDWCNPPGRGLGAAPTTTTGNALVDAYLWVKVPGESDGQCNRGTGGTTDPAWGGVADPAAGAWFAQQADELIRLASPALTPSCRVSYTTTSRWPGTFATTVRLTNTGNRAINGWQLRWTFTKGEVAGPAWNAVLRQTGPNVAVTNVPWNQVILQKQSAVFTFSGRIAKGKPATPASFTVNGVTCTT